MNITKIKIYGERCSGTNYLEQLILTNFNVKSLQTIYGWKHFFGYSQLKNTDDTLFIGIVRDPTDWLNSFYINHHHLPITLYENTENFLNNTFYSLKDNGKEIMQDRHIFTKKRYKNIFELRETKLKYLLFDMPKLVKHYILIKYEDLINNFKDTIVNIAQKGLPINNLINYPQNIFYYKNNKNEKYTKKEYATISKDMIKDKLNLYYENDLLNYNI